jgi:hypothetical protein
MSGIAIDVRRAAAFLLAGLWIALTATFVRAESLAQGAFAPWRSEPPDTVDVILRPLARELTAGSATAQAVYRNPAFGIVATAPPGYVQCKYKSETDHGAVFVKGTVESCGTGRRAENYFWVSAWHSMADNDENMPPIRREIAADKCKPNPGRNILAFRPVDPIAGVLPAFFCALERVDPESGKRVYFADLMFFRGNPPPPARPFPIYEYTLAIEAPAAAAAEAERLLFEAAGRVRLLPIR